MQLPTTQHESRWPNLLAWLVAATTFPLIWVGGLVTTHEAGMAVPDWPNTYGYNLFLYPWQTWLLGPWDLFIEHGHRLLGAAVGFFTILLALAVWFARPAGVPRWLGWVALVAVIGQGALGGMRVLFDARDLAMVHACTAPAFFALAVAILVATSRGWNRVSTRLIHDRAGSLQASAVLAAVVAYLQIVLGAQLRHVAASAVPDSFRIFVVFHLAGAALLAALAVVLVFRCWRQFRAERPLVLLSSAVAILVIAQVSLGGLTWLTNYGWPWPAWTPDWIAGRTIVAGGAFQSLITTGHVALGSLIVVNALALAMWSFRLLTVPASSAVARNNVELPYTSTTSTESKQDRAELACLSGSVGGVA